MCCAFSAVVSVYALCIYLFCAACQILAHHGAVENNVVMIDMPLIQVKHEIWYEPRCLFSRLFTLLKGCFHGEHLELGKMENSIETGRGYGAALIRTVLCNSGV